MPYIERLIPKGINKDVSPRALDSGGNRRVVNPLVDALNARYVTSEVDEIGIEQSIPGNVLKDITLPAGTNKTIGSFTDTTNNLVIFFNWNSIGLHGVYSWNPDTESFTIIVLNQILNFSDLPKHRITGIGMCNDLLYWTDNLNPQRVINIKRNYIAFNSTLTSESISLFKKAPVNRPKLGVAHRTGSDPVIINYVLTNNYQFATQYLFIDNEISALSDYSNVSPSDSMTSVDGDQSTTTRGSISVEHYYDVNMLSTIKEVRCLFRKSETDSWQIYNTTPQSQLSGGIIQTRLYDNVSYDSVDVTTASKNFETIPVRSKALTVFKNRTFLVSDVDGFNVDAYGTPFANIASEAFNTASEPYEFYMKEGGSYSVGIEYFDAFKRSMGVFNPIQIKTDYTIATSPVEVNLGAKKKPVISIGGNTPSWAKYYRLVRTKEQTYEKYMQFPAKVLYYVSEKGTNSLPFNTSEFNNGKIYLNNIPNSAANWSQVHFQVPNNIPWTPDTECFVRIVYAGGVGTKKFSQVINFDGQVIATDNFGLSNWTSVPKIVLIEVLKFKKEKEKFYYGCSDLFQMDGQPHSISFLTTLKMDTVTIRSRFTFSNLSKVNTVTGNTYDPIVSSTFSYFESPTTAGVKSIANTDVATPFNVTSIFGEPKIADYSKLINNIGRESLLANNPVELKRKTTIKFSDPFIQDSSVNGLSSFFAANEYALPQNRTPITKLQPADQVLLAIHERNVTSLYVGEGVIQDSRGNQTITKTDAVIGQDNVLDGGYGSYHPESVAEIEGMVFGFDIFKGVIWRYTVAGVKPISEFGGMSTYFKQKAEQYIDARDSIAIVGGIDPYNNEYIITFPAIEGVAGETWAFNYRKDEWVCRYSFLPEAYANISNKLISFVDGKLWLHNEDLGNYNTFYGVKYQRILRFAFNVAPTKIKNFIALQVSAEKIAMDDSPNTVFVRCYDKEGQETYMRVNAFDKEEGIYYGPILKDIHSIVEAGQNPVLEGNDMRSQVLEIQFEYDGNDAGKWRYANVIFVMSEYSH